MGPTLKTLRGFKGSSHEVGRVGGAAENQGRVESVEPSPPNENILLLFLDAYKICKVLLTS